MITTPAELRAYFANVAADLGASFQFGNSEAILNRLNSQMTYPLIWLEIPDMRLLRNGSLQREFGFAFLCLTDKPVNDLTGPESSLDAMHLLTEQVLQRMQADSEAHPTPFIFDMNGASSEYKGKWSADDDWGWRTECTLIGAACETVDCC